MTFLAVDTSGKTISVAVSKDEAVLGEIFINAGFTHSQTLMPMIESVLSNTGVNIDEVDVFAVSSGPGSFTGVRIGVSGVKGMAFALNKKCISVSSLEAMAYNLIDKDCIISACMDARREQVYNAIFRSSGGKLSRLTSDRLIKAENLAEELSKYNEEVNFVGDGAKMCYNITRQNFTGLKVHLAGESLRYTKASGVLRAAKDMSEKNELLDADSLAPTYLRLSQAERELQKRNKMKDGDDSCE